MFQTFVIPEDETFIVHTGQKIGLHSLDIGTLPPASIAISTNDIEVPSILFANTYAIDLVLFDADLHVGTTLTSLMKTTSSHVAALIPIIIQTGMCVVYNHC